MIVLAWILAVVYSLKTGLNAAGVIWGENVSTRIVNAISSTSAGLVVYFMIAFLRM
ncbi:hypothetical protein M5W68_20570 [Paenibacillus larvae]|uniref:hypothetical protein n=1 Tax=Paenibacillus larvae TaxID=1464 RepID=UPI00227DC7FA|nr:hypothetical protein [Paenibacillus larvae]MCY9527423.1 hypothetical protein [Paenibacillus larvae]